MREEANGALFSRVGKNWRGLSGDNYVAVRNVC